MTDIIILIVAIIISIGITTYILKLKSKSEQSSLQERLNQMHLANDDLKQALIKLENERDKIREEKELLLSELARTNADFDNLKQKNDEQKAEIHQGI